MEWLNTTFHEDTSFPGEMRNILTKRDKNEKNINEKYRPVSSLDISQFLSWNL